MSWLLSQPELNLSTAQAADTGRNSIVSIELQHPNKSQALLCIDQGGLAPDRYARATLSYQTSHEPYFADILVGPLPLSIPPAAWSPLDFDLTRKTGGKVRNLRAGRRSKVYQDWISSVGRSVADITLHLLGAIATGQKNDTLEIIGTTPSTQETGRIVNWFMFRGRPSSYFDTETLLPSGLYFRADVTGKDPAHWQIRGWLYNDVFYNNSQELRDACFRKGFRKIGMNVEGNWARTGHFSGVLPMEKFAAPMATNFGEPRYLLDRNESLVRWMGFSFNFGFSQTTGLALFDIRYRGVRILYELSLQEALAHYAGRDPFQASSAPTDSNEGLGLHASELIPGYDCPSYSTFMNTTYFHGQPRIHVNTLCLFEGTADAPLHRHTSAKYATASKNSYLTFRWCSTMGDYDFMFSYSFFLDGTIQVEVLASGYIISAHYANNQDYGYHIHDFLSGSMHDHVMNFKADFDIIGAANSVQLSRIVPQSIVFPWSEGKARNSMALERAVVETEDEGRWNWDANDQTQFLVTNQESKNRFGESRGYRIRKHSGATHLVVQDSPVLGHAVHWAEADIHITKQHDYEPRSAHPYNNQDVFDPPVNFAEFFNGEGLQQTDIVIWVNLGMHHVPTTADLPNTLTTNAQSSVRFSPHNMDTGHPIQQMVNQVRIKYGEGEVTQVETFGQTLNSTDLNANTVDERLWHYHGMDGLHP